MVRWDWLNIGFLLLGNALRQTVQLLAEVFNLPARRLTLLEIHLRCARARQSPLGAVDEGGGHLQIAQQSGSPWGGSWRFRLGLDLEKQLGLVEKALADQGRTVAPGGIQLPRLPRIAVMPSEDGGHPLAVLQAEARYRHQELHGHVGGDLALAYLLLDGLRSRSTSASRRDTQLRLRSKRRANSSRP